MPLFLLLEDFILSANYPHCHNKVGLPDNKVKSGKNPPDRNCLDGNCYVSIFVGSETFVYPEKPLIQIFYLLAFCTYLLYLLYSISVVTPFCNSCANHKISPMKREHVKRFFSLTKKPKSVSARINLLSSLKVPFEDVRGKGRIHPSCKDVKNERFIAGKLNFSSKS